MFRILSIGVLALGVGCQSASGPTSCLDQGHITSVTGDLISFCSEHLEPGSELRITVQQPGPPGKGYRSFSRRIIGKAAVVNQSEGLVQARIVSGYARTGAHAAP